MNKIYDYSFHDSNIKKISTFREKLEVTFSLWDEKQIKLIFCGYKKVNYTFSNEDIQELLISSESLLLKEAIEETIMDGGSEKEANSLSSYMFIGTWNERVILEIVATDVTIDEG